MNKSAMRYMVRAWKKELKNRSGICVHAVTATPVRVISPVPVSKQKTTFIASKMQITSWQKN